MEPCRLHLLGASGSGTTTLGRLVANEWSVPHADADDYFWLPTSPPYETKRPVEDRLRLMHHVFVPRDAWVLSGSVMGWGEPLVERFDAVAFLALERDTRLHRLRAREARRHGASIEPGGSRESSHREFIEWAGGYDDPEFTGRSRARHEEWLRAVPCPVLHLDSSAPPAELLAAVREWQPADSRSNVRGVAGGGPAT
jgi:adenylate kinase family enzyme